ncbi:hypothetical protein BpHYR1_051995 [Brachionus plicatilis]|uniref:Uncharacterized protein n=1 Tax=Brachionus plicatilis TaxID=10195 RepID=A0A3M7RSY0_BRAPC|nr:hypothetical protein BpHYR1_051995 [Brachionus plicatilis]
MPSESIPHCRKLAHRTRRQIHHRFLSYQSSLYRSNNQLYITTTGLGIQVQHASKELIFFKFNQMKIGRHNYAL